MFGENKNLKDSSNNLGLTIKDSPLVISYTKTDKLITALYMVTDIMDKDEPLRSKLRTLGIGIISDINVARQNYSGEIVSFMHGKITEIVSFLEIASAVNIISEMNCNILKKEFVELKQSILPIEIGEESEEKRKILNRQINLSEFFRESASADRELSAPKHFKDGYQSIGHAYPTRIGVQKGSTLMNALKGVSVSNKGNLGQKNNKSSHGSNSQSFDILKKERREEIMATIKSIGGNATIKDIKDKARINPKQAGLLVSCSDKTLQRELISMLKDNVLNKTGEKRWSRYFLK